jgi:hypothetical protein
MTRAFLVLPVRLKTLPAREAKGVQGVRRDPQQRLGALTTRRHVRSNTVQAVNVHRGGDDRLVLTPC